MSLLPLLVMVALTGGLGYFFWDGALQQVRAWLDAMSITATLWAWLDGAGLGNLKTVLAPLVVIFCVTPAIVVVSLLAVALMILPALVRLVARRRFPNLAAMRGSSFMGAIGWSLGSTGAALLALVVSSPLWVIPPLILVLPPVIWGWLTYRVMAFDALCEYASAEERRTLLKRHRLTLFAMGVLTGFFGAAPSLLWASGVVFAAAFPLLVPVAVWIYMLVFAFSALWFVHFCLSALDRLRSERPAPTDSAALLPYALAREET